VYTPRTLEAYVKKAARQVPVLLVTGARQVGKTTLLRHASDRRRTYVTLDDPLVLRLAREDPALFMQRFPPPVLIDEIQYAPALLPHIKMAVDRARKPGLFWLTGSQQFHLMRGVSESLAGRAGVVRLLGLSRRELLRQASASRPFLPLPERIRGLHASGGSLGLGTLFDLIWRGSFPSIALDRKADWQLFYGSYVQTYLQRDIRDLAQVGDEIAFLRFLRAAAARTGQLLNLSDLARDADVAPNTAKHWLSILRASGIAYLLEPYHANLARRMVKAAKLYFLDTGLCAYLTAWSAPQALEAGAMSGAMLETWVVSELLKGYWHNGLEAPFHYYRDRDMREIDLLIVRDRVIHPLEVKKSASPSPEDVRHFQALRRLRLATGAGGVICLARGVLPLTASAHAIPVAAL
jgi:hypothetical protein